MNSWVLLVLAISLMLLPLGLLRLGDEPAERRRRPEIHGMLRPLEWLTIAYCTVWHRLQINRIAPLPEFGPAILIANHTCGIDHLVLQSGCRRVLGFMIAREYYDWPLIHPFCKIVQCIPVNRDGRDVQATRGALRALADGRVVPIFPEGRITPASGRVLGEIKPGAAFIAVRSGVPVIPAFIQGTPETAEIGESLKTFSRAVVRFGPPIDLSDFRPRQAGDKDVLAEVSRRFERALLELKDGSTSQDPASMARPVHAF